MWKSAWAREGWLKGSEMYSYLLHADKETQASGSSYLQVTQWVSGRAGAHSQVRSIELQSLCFFLSVTLQIFPAEEGSFPSADLEFGKLFLF